MRRLAGLLVLVLGLSVLTGLPVAVADPEPGECEALTTAQLGDPATRITGMTTADPDDFDCYVLPDAAGTLYRFTPVRSYVELELTVHNGAGDVICNLPVGGPEECRLSGAGPFTMRVGYPFETAQVYSLQILRITGGNGCPPHGFGAFGSAANVFHVENHDADGGSMCWKVEVPDGPLMNFARSDWTIYDPQGVKLCDFTTEDSDPMPFHCRPNYTGPAVMTLQPHSWSNELVPVIAVRNTASCGSAIGTAWSQPPLQVPAASGVVQCHPIAAPAGTRVVPAFGDFINGNFDRICATTPVYEVGAPYGCRLEGPPPYRILTTSLTPDPGEPPTYPVVARTLTPGADCPTVQPTPWGSVPSDQHPGMGCRQFRATAGQSFVFGSIESDEGEAGQRGTHVVDESGAIACVTKAEGDSRSEYPDLPCDDLNAGRYVAVTDPLGSDHVTMLYDRASFAGCRPQPPTMSLEITPAAPGQIDCYRVAQPYGGVLAWFDPGNPEHPVNEADDTNGQVFRADGSDLHGVVCKYAVFCLKASDGPHRLIVGNGSDPENVFTHYTLEDLTDCQRVGRGTTEVRLSEAAQVRCVLIDRIAASREDIDLGSDARFQARQAIFSGVTSCRGDRSGFRFLLHDTLICGPGDGLSASLVVLVGSGDSQTVTFVRDAPAVRNRTRPRVLGIARVGATVRVSSGTWTPPSAKLTYQWTVNGRDIKGARKPSLRLRSRYAGKKVTVRVTGTAQEHYVDIATARQVRVRR